jgi:hypothetical protein
MCFPLMAQVFPLKISGFKREYTGFDATLSNYWIVEKYGSHLKEVPPWDKHMVK